MNDISFANAKKVSFRTPQVNSASEAPYDPNLTYNRIIQPAGPKNKFPTRSIDSGSILKKIEGNKLRDLEKITLACSFTHKGLIMWDALTNLTSIAGTTSCIFLANSDYSPLEKGRIMTSSQFLNYSMPGARLQLNRVEVGDKIGIGIYNCVSHTSYVLIYEVSSKCVTQDTPRSDGKDSSKRDERPTLIHGVNCDLQLAYSVDVTGDGDVVDNREEPEDSEILNAFVSYIVNTVMDITSAYPWKAHFLPISVSSWDREVIELRLKQEYEKVLPGTYEDFEDSCRDVYNEIRYNKIAANNTNRQPKRQGRGQNKGKNEEAKTSAVKAPSVPTVEVVTLKESGTFLAKLTNEETGTVQLFRFSSESVGSKEITEKFLTNKDLEAVDASENTDVLTLSKDVFDEEATVRFFSANF